MAIGAGAHGKVTIDDAAIKEWTAEKVSNEALKEALKETVGESGIYRFSKSRMPKDYMEYQDKAQQNETSEQNQIITMMLKTPMPPKMVGWQAIASDELVSEFMLNALRLHDGVAWSLFKARTGLSYDSIAVEVNKLIKQGLLIDDNEHLQPTALGRRYLNQILRVFL